MNFGHVVNEQILILNFWIIRDGRRTPTSKTFDVSQRERALSYCDRLNAMNANRHGTHNTYEFHSLVEYVLKGEK